MPTRRATSECDECGLVLLRSNMSRHLQSHQPQKRVRWSSASASLSCRATTLSAGRPTSPATQSTGDNVFYAMSTEDGTRCKPAISNPIITSIPKRTTVHPRLSLEEYLIANAAAASLTEQHHIYNLDGLCDYVADHFPSVPAAVRPYLVIGAVAGAQHAAQIHYLLTLTVWLVSRTRERSLEERSVRSPIGFSGSEINSSAQVCTKIKMTFCILTLWRCFQLKLTFQSSLQLPLSQLMYLLMRLSTRH